MDELGGFLIPILVPLGFFAMIFGIVYLRNRERMAMIERGMNPKIDVPTPYVNLKWGLIFIGGGLGLVIGYIINHAWLVNQDENSLIYIALISMFGGIGLLISSNIDRKNLLNH